MSREAASFLAQQTGIGGFGFLDPLFVPEQTGSRIVSREWSSRTANPHLTQVSDGATPMHGCALPILLHPQAPMTIYRRRRDEDKSVIHWGQRKLLISEICFLIMLGCSPTHDDVASTAATFATSRSESIAFNAISRALSALAALGSGESVVEARTSCSSAKRHSKKCTYRAWLVYAGAAPGTHIPILASLFPRVLFILIDPAPFKCGRVIRLQSYSSTSLNVR